MADQRIQFQVSKRQLWQATGPDRIVLEGCTLADLRARIQSYVRARYGESLTAVLLVGGQAPAEPVVPALVERSAA
jgi:hypothetical protein